MYKDILFYVILVALCAASISYTITFAGIFKKVVDWIGSKNKWLDELVHCPYCFGHYVVLTIMLTTSNIQKYLFPVTNSIVYNFLFTWFAIICLMSTLHYIMLHTYGIVAEMETKRKLRKIKEQIKNQD